MGLRSIVSSAAVALALVVAGCAGPGSQRGSVAASRKQGAVSAPNAENGDGQKDPDRTYICSYERPTGSNIPVRVCRSLRQIEAEKQKSQQDLGAVRARPSSGH